MTMQLSEEVKLPPPKMAILSIAAYLYIQVQKNHSCILKNGRNCEIELNRGLTEAIHVIQAVEKGSEKRSPGITTIANYLEPKP